MIRSRRSRGHPGQLVLLVLALLLAAQPAPGPVVAQAADYELDVPAGAHFYTQAGAGTSGYVVSDHDDVPFLTFFRLAGGVDDVGYPISHRFVRDGRVVQAFQKVVFEWHADVGEVRFLNTLDVLHDVGLDGALASTRQVPPSADWSADGGLPFDRVVLRHLELLEASPAIKAAYFAAPDALSRHGLPMAPLRDMGGVLVLRAQRTVFQQWLDDQPWARAGEVTTVSGGDLARQLGLFPPEAVTPLPATLAPLSAAYWPPASPVATAVAGATAVATPVASPTPTSLPTPAATPTPSGPCFGDEQMTFYPPAPAPGQEVYVSVSSARRATGVGLSGAFGPAYQGLYPGGLGWFWTWRIRPDRDGQFAYDFTVGGSVCAAGSVRVGWNQPAQLIPRPLVPPMHLIPVAGQA